MGEGATQLAFAAQCGLFLVATAGAALALRRDLLGRDRAARLLLALGFSALAVAAFLAGTLVVGRDDAATQLVAVRLGGVVLLGLGALGWAGGRAARALLALGGLGVMAAAIAAATVDDPVGPAWVLVASLVPLAGSLVVAGRRSVPARIGVSAALVVLAVVVGVSIAQSVVLSRTVSDEALRRYASRTEDEAAAAVDAGSDALDTAQLVGGTVVARDPEPLRTLARPSPETSAADRDQARAQVQADLDEVTSERLLAIDDPVVVVTPDGVPEVAVPDDLANATRIGISGDPVITEALSQRAARQSVSVIDGAAYALAAVPLTVAPDEAQETFVGLAVVSDRLDDTFLKVRDTGGEALSFALVGREGPLAVTGPQPPASTLRQLGREVIEQGGRPDRTVGDRFVAARPVSGEDQVAQLALITSAPTATVADTREALLQALFLVALGAALLAVVVTAVVGDRIGAGLRQLTGAAQRIRSGDLDARAGLDSPDEVGTLGAAFDDMATSVRSLTGDLRQAARDEAELRARLEAVIGGMGEALVATGPDGRVTDWNQAAEAVTGRAAGDALGHPLGEVLVLSPGSSQGGVEGGDGGDGPPGEPEPLGFPDAGVTVREGTLMPIGPTDGDAGTVSDTGEPGVSDAGSGGVVPIPVVVTLAPLTGADREPVGGVAVIRDLRRELEVEAMKGDFLATVGHELRTPLTPIKGYASVLSPGSDPPDPDRISAAASGIQAGVERLERVIGQLVTFAAVGPGQASLDRRPTDVNQVVSDTVARWRERIGDGHDLRHQGGAGIEPLPADPHQLATAIDELVDNAVKYSPDGGEVIVGVDLIRTGAGPSEAASTGNGGDQVRIWVRDHGVGLPVDGWEAMTEAFSQGDPSGTRRFGGLGLGLALVDRIVTAHGGHLTGENPTDGGAGACVSILMPVHGEPGDADGAR